MQHNRHTNKRHTASIGASNGRWRDEKSSHQYIFKMKIWFITSYFVTKRKIFAVCVCVFLLLYSYFSTRDYHLAFCISTTEIQQKKRSDLFSRILTFANEKKKKKKTHTLKRQMYSVHNTGMEKLVRFENKINIFVVRAMAYHNKIRGDSRRWFVNVSDVPFISPYNLIA